MTRINDIDDYYVYLNEKLGEGSFGKVFKGLKKSNNLPVAVKIISKQKWYNEQEQLEQFKKEIRIMRNLNHPNIIKYIDTFQTSKNLYLIEELCEGDLYSYLRDNKQNLSQASAIEILKQICQGCSYLIQKGIVHRDLKPQNIMYSKKTFKIGDFGQAKINKTKDNLNSTFVGTPGYMSPQIMENQKYSSKCDIWSIGVIFYQILNGKLPWNGSSLMGIKFNTYKLRLNINTTKLKKETVDFIKRCLKINQADRFSWQQMLSHPIFEQ